MNHPPAVHTTLSALSRASSVTNASLLGQALAASQTPTKHGRKAQTNYQQFWLDVSKTAAQHNCRITTLRQRLHAMRSDPSTDEETSTSGRGESDLLIVGPGVLGSLIGKLWQEQHVDAEVVGQTNTETNHERLRTLGIAPRLKQDAGGPGFPNVIFCAPPSGSKDYVSEVRGALHHWNRRGTFIFTSSSGVMHPEKGEDLTDTTPLHAPGTSDRTDRLLGSEQAVLEAGGCVARFVGLYHARRGAHTFFLQKGEVERWGGHIVNLIHYEDAARFCLKILAGHSCGERFSGQVFFGTDGCPLTFQEMMDATLDCKEFEGNVTFTGPKEAAPGPGSSNNETREKLQWSPKHKSFKEFMHAGAQDAYQSLYL